jgi:YtkA-like
MRRGLLVIVLGIGFLILITWLGTFITEIIPQRLTPQMQTADVGPYTVTLKVNPNPPLITQPATLSLTVVLKGSQQTVSNAQVAIHSNMESMDMGIDAVHARPQGDGVYIAHVQFSMSGTWSLQVVITPPDQRAVTAAFEVTAQ